MRVLAHVVSGEEPSLLAHATTQLIDQVCGAEKDMVLQEVSVEESLTSALRSVSLFTDFQVILVRGKLEVDRLAEVIEYLKDPEPSSVLVLSVPKAPPSLVKAIKAVGGTVQVTQGKNHHETGRALLENAPVRLDGRARALLLERTGEDLARIPALLDLLLSTFGPGAALGVEEIEPFLGASGTVPLWELTDAIDEGNVTKALATLQRLLPTKAPILLSSVLSSHMERMFRVSQMGFRDEAEAAAFLGMKGSTFPAKKAIQTARRYGSALPALVVLTTKASNDLKGFSGLPPEAILEVLVARLAAHPRS